MEMMRDGMRNFANRNTTKTAAQREAHLNIEFSNLLFQPLEIFFLHILSSLFYIYIT